MERAAAGRDDRWVAAREAMARPRRRTGPDGATAGSPVARATGPVPRPGRSRTSSPTTRPRIAPPLGHPRQPVHAGRRSDADRPDPDRSGAAAEVAQHQRHRRAPADPLYREDRWRTEAAPPPAGFRRLEAGPLHPPGRSLVERGRPPDEGPLRLAADPPQPEGRRSGEPRPRPAAAVPPPAAAAPGAGAAPSQVERQPNAEPGPPQSHDRPRPAAGLARRESPPGAAPRLPRREPLPKAEAGPPGRELLPRAVTGPPWGVAGSPRVGLVLLKAGPPRADDWPAAQAPARSPDLERPARSLVTSALDPVPWTPGPPRARRPGPGPPHLHHVDPPRSPPGPAAPSAPDAARCLVRDRHPAPEPHPCWSAARRAAPAPGRPCPAEPPRLRPPDRALPLPLDPPQPRPADRAGPRPAAPAPSRTPRSADPPLLTEAAQPSHPGRRRPHDRAPGQEVQARGPADPPPRAPAREVRGVPGDLA